MSASILLPDAPAVVAGNGRAAILTRDGELTTLPAADAVALLRREPPPLLIHAPATRRRLGQRPHAAHGAPAYDLLELFAFVLPARPAPPTPRGLALALDLPAARHAGGRGGPAAADRRGPASRISRPLRACRGRRMRRDSRR